MYIYILQRWIYFKIEIELYVYELIMMVWLQQFIGDTDELWAKHSDKDFRKHKPDEFESWREMYLVCNYLHWKMHLRNIDTLT